MKKILVTLLFTICYIIDYGQIKDVENLMTRRVLHCEDIHYNLSYLIPDYYQKKSVDTLNAILEFWHKQCGESEIYYRFKILFAIENRTFNESLYNEFIINYLESFKIRVENLKRNVPNYGYQIYYNYNTPRILDSISYTIAMDLIDHKENTTLENFFLQFYTNNPEVTINLLQNSQFNHTQIQQYYLKKKEKLKNQVKNHQELSFGAWIPQGKLSKLGIHPNLGVSLGFDYKNMFLNISAAIKFGKTANTYQVYKNDSLWNTRHFLGANFGLDLGYQLPSSYRNKFYFLGGIAYDMFEALNVKVSDPVKDTITKNLGSLNLNLGFKYKHIRNNGNYFGFEMRYNFLNFKNPNGTELSGNVISVSAFIGFAGKSIFRKPNSTYYYYDHINY